MEDLNNVLSEILKNTNEEPTHTCEECKKKYNYYDSYDTRFCSKNCELKQASRYIKNNRTAKQVEYLQQIGIPKR